MAISLRKVSPFSERWFLLLRQGGNEETSVGPGLTWEQHGSSDSGAYMEHASQTFRGSSTPVWIFGVSLPSLWPWHSMFSLEGGSFLKTFLSFLFSFPFPWNGT